MPPPQTCLSSVILFLKTYGCHYCNSPQPFLPFSGSLGFHLWGFKLPKPRQAVLRDWHDSERPVSLSPYWFPNHLFWYCLGNAKSISEMATHIVKLLVTLFLILLQVLLNSCLVWYPANSEDVGEPSAVHGEFTGCWGRQITHVGMLG